MSLMKLVSLFVFTLIQCITYANENTYVLFGENESVSKTAFVLELADHSFENNIFISQNGEVYVKADKIIAIPRETFSYFSSLSDSTSSLSFLALSIPQNTYEEMEIRCPACRCYYVPQPGKWDCPNPRCPSNQK